MNDTLQNGSLTSARPFVAACAASCKKLLTGIQRIRSALLREFSQRAFTQDRLVQLALNEAEALAFDSGFPQLTFPVLAREKVQAVAAWQHRQRKVRRTSFDLLAA